MKKQVKVLGVVKTLVLAAFVVFGSAGVFAAVAFVSVAHAEPVNVADFGAVAQGSPSESYLATARVAYRSPEYAAGTNTVVTRWKAAPAEYSDRPVAGGKIRWVHVEGMHNVRDIGGWNGLRTGLVYRGTEPDCHQENGKYVHGLNVTSNGLDTIHRVMKIKTDLDLRRDFECPHPEYSSLGVTLIRAPARAYKEFDQTKQHWAKALRVFADAKNYPIYFHCWGGADRTGILAFLIEGLCGVDEADLAIDYELTSFGQGLRTRDPSGPAGRGYLDTLNRVKGCPGATLADKFATFVERELGITKDEIAAIRACVALSAGTTLAGGVVITVDPADVKAEISPNIYGLGMEDVNHEIYGDQYARSPRTRQTVRHQRRGAQGPCPEAVFLHRRDARHPVK